MTTAFIGVWLAGSMAAWDYLNPYQHQYLVQKVGLMSPFWAPFVFAAYALGRKAVTGKLVIAFAVAELVAISWTRWWMHNA